MPSFTAFGGTPAENYQRYFVPAIGAPIADNLIEVAALRPGERVLDIACGTGVVTRLAADRVGTTGAVAGLDINPSMLEVARSVTPSGMDIEWYEASADDLPFSDDVLDVVLYQMGLQFFPDILAAAALEEGVVERWQPFVEAGTLDLRLTTLVVTARAS